MAKEVYIPRGKWQQLIDELQLLLSWICDENGVPEDHKFTEQTNDQPSKFRTRKWVEVNDYTNNGKYGPDSSIRFNITMLKSRIYDDSDTYILVQKPIRIEMEQVQH